MRGRVTGTGEIVGSWLMAGKKRDRVSVAAIVVLASALALSGCGDKFSAACKSAINQSIDLNALTAQLSGGSGAPCAGATSGDLAVACAALADNVASLAGSCGDARGDALDAALLGNRQ